MCTEKLAPTDKLSLIMIYLQRYKHLFGPVAVFLMEKILSMKSSTEVSLVLGVADPLWAFPHFSFLQPFFWPFLNSNSKATMFKIVSKGLRFHFIKAFPWILFMGECNKLLKWTTLDILQAQVGTSKYNY